MLPRVRQISSALALAAPLALLASSCGSTSPTGSGASGSGSSAAHAASRPGAGKPPVTLATKNFPEQFILGQLYAQALRAKGFRIKLESDLGSSEVVDRKLTAGTIDGYPEYTGTVLTVLAHDPRRPASASQAYAEAAAFERRRGIELMAMAPAEDKDVIIALPAYAKAHRLTGLSDLRRLGRVTLAAPPEFRTRFNGLVGLREDYGLTKVHMLPVKIGRQYPALQEGAAGLALGFTTDGNLSRGGFATLADPRNIFGFQNVTFLVRRKVLTREGAAFGQTINAVSAKLSTQALRVMNAAVELDQQSPTLVARQFLQANGLL